MMNNETCKSDNLLEERATCCLDAQCVPMLYVQTQTLQDKTSLLQKKYETSFYIPGAPIGPIVIQFVIHQKQSLLCAVLLFFFFHQNTIMVVYIDLGNMIHRLLQLETRSVCCPHNHFFSLGFLTFFFWFLMYCTICVCVAWSTFA